MFLPSFSNYLSGQKCSGGGISGEVAFRFVLIHDDEDLGASKQLKFKSSGTHTIRVTRTLMRSNFKFHAMDAQVQEEWIKQFQTELQDERKRRSDVETERNRLKVSLSSSCYTINALITNTRVDHASESS